MDAIRTMCDYHNNMFYRHFEMLSELITFCSKDFTHKTLTC